MTEYTPEEVRTLLARHGLTAESFDADEIAADLTDRTALNDGLDELLAGEDRPDPTAFDPGWAQ